jgi:hypothetical protein
MLVNVTIERPWVFHFWGFALVVDYLIEAQHLATDQHNMSIASPSVAALSGLGLVIICRDFMAKLLSEKFRRTIYALALLAIAAPGPITSSFSKGKWFDGDYWPYYDLGKELARISESNDLLVSFGRIPIAIYYSGLHGWQFPPADVWPYQHKIGTPELVNLLESLRRRGARWLVVTSDQPEIEPLLKDYISLHYELVHDSSAGKIYRAR